MKKAALLLLLLLYMAVALPTVALSAARQDYVFITDLSQYKNKKVNILTPDAEKYDLQYREDEDNNVYFLTLLDSQGNELEAFPQDVKIYFPHYTRDNLSYYSYIITQKSGSDVITYSTADETVKAYERYGVEIQTDRLGEFQISYTIADNIGPTWNDVMDMLAETAPNSSSDDGNIRVTRSGNTITFEGLRDDSRLCTDADLIAEDYVFPGSHFVFDNVELQEVRIYPQEGDNWTVHFTDSVQIRRGVEVWMKHSDSRVHLINDTEIQDLDQDLSQRDYPLMVDVPYGSSFLLTGKGSIPVDYCRWRTGTLEDPYVEWKSALVNVFVKADSTEESVPRFAKVFSDIQLDQNQFPTKDLSKYVRTCLVNETRDGDSYEVVYEDHPAASNLSELNANRINLLLPGAHDNADFTISVTIHDQGGDRAIAYDLVLTDNKKQEFADIADGADLYLPYPAGMDMQSAAQYAFTVTHYTAYGEETFSTRNGTLELTPYGLRMRIHSMSPFLLTWDDVPVSVVGALPKTGDGSRLGLWLALLAMAAAAAVLSRRKTA